MNYMLLSNTIDYSQPIAGVADKLSFGGMMLLIGIAAVFSVLTIIWLALTIFSAVFKKISESRRRRSKASLLPNPLLLLLIPTRKLWQLSQRLSQWLKAKAMESNSKLFHSDEYNS